MLANIWKKISYSGVNSKLQPSEARYTVLVNRFAMISALVTLISLLLLLVEIPDRGLTPTRLLLLSSSGILLGVIAMNSLGHRNAAKWTISWLPPIIIIFISIADKTLLAENITIKDFFSFRFFLMSSTIIPVLVFSTRQMASMVANMIPSFTGVVFFELIHKAFGVSFHQFGYDEPHFFVLDIMIAIAYLSLVGFLLHQRCITDDFEIELQDKQEILEEKNKELSHMNMFINEQNSEMNAQAEKIMESHEALLEANRTIEEQKKLLEAQNMTLEEQVREKTRDLSMVNEEMMIRNNELRQFSHTLSHNLKSPVATFQGLLNLVDVADLNESNKELYNYLNQSVCKMQEVFSDMNQMLEIRNKLYKSIEEVNLQKLIDGLHSHFYHELRSNNIQFQYDFNGCKSVRTNEEQLNSILFHLISNSIKFRSEKRKPLIDIKLHGNGAYQSIVVRDNGLGIDMRKYASKLFFPYQQFHNESSGKGLGLYLVKLQAESLGGNVRIASEPDLYTEVEVKLKK
jgi:signal transduction histidine kinase